ncbi:MAG: energy transducer TonB [Bacteroidetes bacterium]|nr:MAG: energy transducer TonB [Bacteroidota bacterium]
MATAAATTTYGFQELRILTRKYSTVALVSAGVLHVSVIGAYYGIQKLMEEDEPVYTVRIMKYSDLGPPPSITNSQAAPAVSVQGPVAKPTVGTPVPVPDAEINPEQTIATQTEMAAVGPSIGEGVGDGGPVEIQEDVSIQDDGPPPDFVPVEKQPQPIPGNNPSPTYPEIARRAGVEGTVWVKIWVDKEGNPKKAQVLKSDAELFNQPAIEAAMKWKFTPAIMNNGPVSVWVSIPFRFKLNQGR